MNFSHARVTGKGCAALANNGAEKRFGWVYTNLGQFGGGLSHRPCFLHPSTERFMTSLPRCSPPKRGGGFNHEHAGRADELDYSKSFANSSMQRSGGSVRR